MCQSSGKLLLCLFMPVLLLSCQGGKGKKKDDAGRDYSVLTLQPRSATTYRDFPATIQGQQVVEIRPMVDGYLEAIYVPEGATVSKGQLLFRISNPQYEQQVVTAKAAIKIAEADVNAAKMDVEKVRPLVEKDIVSKYQLQAAQYTLQSKEAALAQAQATLANAQTNIGYTFIHSPQSGAIGLIPYKIGALVNSSTTEPLTTLSNTGNVFAYFSLNEKQLLGLSAHIPGTTIEEKLQHLPPVMLLLADGSLYPEKGKLETASGLIATGTGTASFKATFPNPQGIIRSGASGTVRIPRQNDTALLIPQSATYELQDKVFVYKLTTDNKVQSAAITATATGDGQFLIVRGGLVKGDRIVLNGFNLKDGMPVIPLPVNADSLFQVYSTTAQ